MKEVEFKFNMWEEVQDQRTGFTGTIIGRAEYGDEPNCYFIAKFDPTGKTNEQIWVTESRLTTDLSNSNQ